MKNTKTINTRSIITLVLIFSILAMPFYTQAASEKKEPVSFSATAPSVTVPITSPNVSNTSFSIGTTPVNTVPVAVADEYKVYTEEKLYTNEVKEGVLRNDYDKNNDILEAVYGSGLSTSATVFPLKLNYGTLFEFNSDGTFTYVANSAGGDDEFSYRAYDGKVYSNVVSVVIYVGKRVIPTPDPDVLGCMDTSANNYNSSANVDDGTCTYTSGGSGDGNGGTFTPNSDDEDLEPELINEETEEGSILGDIVFADGLYRCEDDKIFSFTDNVKTYVPDLLTLGKYHFGEDVNYATCEDIANIPEVLGDNTKEECVTNFKPVKKDLFRGTNMKIYAWLNSTAHYVSSLEELARDFFGIEIINLCQTTVDDLVK
jgi:hypothetical protein